MIDKATYGAFCHTDLEQRLRAKGVTKIVLCGVTADVCVHTTQREATDRGFECIYVRDAISTFDPALRQACEQMVLEEGGVWGSIATAREVIASWASGKESSPEP